MQYVFKLIVVVCILLLNEPLDNNVAIETVITSLRAFDAHLSARVVGGWFLN